MPGKKKTQQHIEPATENSRNEIRRFMELMAGLLLEEPGIPTLDDIIETLEILKRTILARDKDKAFEAVTVLLLQMMKFCLPNGETFEKALPELEELKDQRGGDKRLGLLGTVPPGQGRPALLNVTLANEARPVLNDQTGQRFEVHEHETWLRPEGNAERLGAPRK